MLKTNPSIDDLSSERAQREKDTRNLGEAVLPRAHQDGVEYTYAYPTLII